MNFGQLEKHNVIAWDMDGTLVDGKYSAHWRRFLSLTPDRTHYVLTFRTGKSRIAGKPDDATWAGDVYDELASYGISPKLIRGVFGIPSEIFAYYGNDPRYRHDDVHAEDVQKFLLGHQELVEWKGKKANELGATVLIDDMEKMVLPGCQRYGVEFVLSI